LAVFCRAAAAIKGNFAAPEIACGQPGLAFYCFPAMEFAIPTWKNRATPKVFGRAVSVLMTPVSESTFAGVL